MLFRYRFVNGRTNRRGTVITAKKRINVLLWIHIENAYPQVEHIQDPCIAVGSRIHITSWSGIGVLCGESYCPIWWPRSGRSVLLLVGVWKACFHRQIAACHRKTEFLTRIRVNCNGYIKGKAGTTYSLYGDLSCRRWVACQWYKPEKNECRQSN